MSDRRRRPPLVAARLCLGAAVLAMAVVLAGPARGDAPAAGEATLTAPAVPLTVGRGSAFTTTGLLQPRHEAGTTAVTIVCHRLESGAWVERAAFAATLRDDLDSGGSRYSAAVKLPSAGTWTLTATHSDAEHPSAASDPSASVKVTSRLDAPVWNRDGTTTIPEKMAWRRNARQLVVVTGARLGARSGILRLYIYRSGDWVRTMALRVRWGANGLVRGSARRAGSLTTPTGVWRLPGYAFGTHARAPRGSGLRWRHITQRSWWSAERNATYNTWVETSRHVNGEHLADYPSSYEYAISSGFNARPNACVYGRGTAIFLHVTHSGYSQGCVLLPRSEMIRLLRRLDAGKRPACAIGTMQVGTRTCIYAY